MTKMQLLTFWISAFLVVFNSTISGAQETAARPVSKLLAGAAESDITPPVGFPMAGYYHERLATGTKDPLKAKAVVFRDGDVEAAFVIADLTGISRDLCVEVRRRASAKTGIPEKHISVSATHSHTGPDYTRSVYEYLKNPNAVAASTEPIALYPERLIDQIVDAIVKAKHSVGPMQLRSGIANQEKPVSFNRRFVMKDGSIQTWQSLKNPAVVRAAGPINPDVSIFTLTPEGKGTPKAVVSEFALHLDTVGGLLWSGDYPAVIEKTLRHHTNSELISVFGAGTCGDINHVNPSSTERNSTTVIGESLGATIQAALSQLPEVSAGSLQVRSATVPLPLQEVTDSELKRATELLPAAKAGQSIDFFDQVLAYKAIVLDQLRNPQPKINSEEFINWGLSHSWKGIGSQLPVDVMTMTIGDELAIVFLPGEVFVELGLAIKKGSPFRNTMVIELSNGIETLYIPTRAAYPGGGYEVTNSAVEPGSGEMLVEASLRLLRESAMNLKP